MKKFLPLLIVLVSFTQINAQTSQMLITENFTGYTTGNLNTNSSGQGGWTAANGIFSSDFARVATTTPLSYPNYTSGTQYVNLTSNGDGFLDRPDDPAKKFIGNKTVSTTAATTFYMTFVVRVPSSSGVSATGDATPELALRTDDGDNIANFYIAKSGSSLKFGIDKNGGDDGDYAAGNYSYNTTYLIVIRYDIVTSGNNDKMYLWVNPNISSEPSTSSANISITSTSNNSSNSDGYSAGSGNPVNKIQLFQDDHSATASLDAFKVAYGTGFSTVSTNSAAAWNTLSPIGVPLPVKFGDIKGYTKNAGIQVEWTVYSEFNVVRYEIERSSDGVSFSYAGSVAAKNADGTLYYDWFDASPLAGNNYYRIKNVDIDGKSAYSSVVKVSLGKSSATGVTVYPNPVAGNHISLQAADLQSGAYKIEIFSTSGQQVYKKQFSHAGGTINQSLELPNALQTGIYNIQLTGNGFKLVKPFLVR
ncbi:MAG: T9SS type A sorting domain-containing protein [Bacteroidota bacterium]